MPQYLKQSTLWLFLACVMISCGTGNCRQNREQPNAAIQLTPEQEARLKQTSKDKERVRVGIPDGTLQCEEGSGIKQNDAQKKLGKVPFYNVEHKHDGMARIAVCGAATGKYFVFEIDRKSLAQVLNQGFIEWVYE